MKNVIYKIRNVVNECFYVGSTVDSRKRFWQHRKQLRLNVHNCIYLQRAWNKYGEDCFKFEIVEQLESREELFPAEQQLLDQHFGKDYCYNVAAYAGAPMRDASPELRARLAEKSKKWHETHTHPRQGEKHSLESLRLMSESRKGKNAGADHYRYGKQVSPETRAKISATQKGIKKGPRNYTAEGLARAQENMRRNAREQTPAEFAEVLAKFPQEVQEKYDFSKAVYTGALSRITGVVCPEHGEFSNYAARFRKGSGCPQCGAVVRAAKKKEEMLRTWSTEEGRKKFLEPRNNRLDSNQNPV
jgi:group I intron endonuclease